MPKNITHDVTLNNQVAHIINLLENPSDKYLWAIFYSTAILWNCKEAEVMADNMLEQYYERWD